MLLPITGTGGTQTPARMRQTAQAFEAQVLAQLMQPVFDTIDTSKSAFGGGTAEAQWRPIMVEAFAAGAARSGQGIGIQEMVLRHMLRMQDLTANPLPPQENTP